MQRMLVLAAALAGACGAHGPPVYIVLATTTSVGSSGLLDVLVPAWRREGGVEIRPMLVGSGRALRLLEEGQADLVISHAPGMEAAMMATHAAAWHYRKIMYNDFVLVGPAADPAAARTAATLEDALRGIAASKTPFVSRGDRSGTHEREQALWQLAGIAPGEVLTSGAGMAVTLRQASDQDAYTLADRATFEQMKGRVQLQIVWQGDPRLLNSYAVVVNRLGPRSAETLAFADWLAGGRGREAIAAYRIHGSGLPPFTVWPETAGHQPHSVPPTDQRPETRVSSSSTSLGRVDRRTCRTVQG
ncbi:MAG: substrate-binding domain-containing protein [Vicinamibacterales bacterium]